MKTVAPLYLCPVDAPDALSRGHPLPVPGVVQLQAGLHEPYWIRRSRRHET